ncbi:MAG: phage major capsid protein [Gammaproteobacteria bacterium]|nr:phage major capsid protein [Gammaproteobacteria bacterium]
MANLKVGARSSIYGGSDADTMSTIDAILKLDYIMDSIVDTVNRSTWFLSQIKREKMTGGKKFIYSFRTGLAEGQGNRAEDVQLPNFGAGSYEEISYYVRYQYATLRLTGPSMATSNKPAAAYVSILNNALKDVRQGFFLETYFQTIGAESGVVALVAGAKTPSGSPLTADLAFDSPYGQSDGASADLTAKFPFFRLGMQLVFLHPTNATILNAGTVTGIKHSGEIVVATLDETTIMDNARILRGDAQKLSLKRTSYNENYVGLVDTVHNENTYLSFDRTDQPSMQSTVLSANGGRVSEAMLQGAYNQIMVRSDGMNTTPGLLMSGYAEQTLYMQALLGQKRYINPPTGLAGGRSALSFNGIPWTAEKLSPPGRVYFLNMRDWCWAYYQRPQWAQLDGRVLRVPEHMDAATGYMRTYRNLINEHVQNQGMMTNVTGYATPTGLGATV